MLEDNAKPMAYTIQGFGGIQDPIYVNLVYWGTAEDRVKKLARLKTVLHISMPEEPPAFSIPSLDSRRQAAAVGLTCKPLNGQGRGALTITYSQYLHILLHPVIQ